MPAVHRSGTASSTAREAAGVTRLLSDDELDALATTPREEVARALDAGDRTVIASHVRGYLDFVAGFDAFVGAILEHLAATGGHAALTAAAAVEWDVTRQALRLGVTDADFTVSADDRTLDDIVDRASWDRVEAALRRRHDLGRDRLSLHLSHVYRHHGDAALEACFRVAADRTLLKAMPRDLARDPVARVRRWARMGHWNFATDHVEEDDDAFTIVQDPCGTCARQLRDGLYGPPLDLAVVAERGVPVYRDHVRVMHWLVPTERIGRPWPRIECPPGMGAGPCRIVLEK
jgi:hypothetical protein